MTTPEEVYDLQVENIRRAMAEAYAAGYAQGREDVNDDPMAPITPNPYTKEQS